MPAFDSVWDVRVFAAAVLDFAMLGDVAEPWRTVAALVCGTLALSAHGFKSCARLAANASPEPISNWSLSFSEDFAVAGLLWVAVTHRLLALTIAGTVLLAFALAARWMLRALRRFTRRSAPTAR